MADLNSATVPAANDGVPVLRLKVVTRNLVIDAGYYPGADLGDEHSAVGDLVKSIETELLLVLSAASG